MAFIRFISKARTGRHSITTSTRDAVYERDNFICQYCKRKFDRSKLSIEHVIPISKGGIDEIINYITVCRSCNSSKNAKDLKEYVEENWHIQISELPIHGDIIMDTPELDKLYRYAREKAYYIMRRDGTLKGSSALKKLEKLFRLILWESEYGKTLSKRFPNLPGHVRVEIPIVEFIESDTRKPIFHLLLELTKSANTRALVDNILRTLSNNPSLTTEFVVRTILLDKHDVSMQKRIKQALDRAKIKSLDNLFEIPLEMKETPFKYGDIIIVRIDSVENGIGVANSGQYRIFVPNTSPENEYEIVIDKVNNSFANGHIAYLPQC